MAKALLASVALLPVLLACSEATPAAAPGAATAAATVKVTLPVEGMTCEGCESSIRSAVEGLDGVKSCVASHTEGAATIEYDPAKVDPARLSEVIAGLGYKVGASAKPAGAAAP